jgi:hypothetical protein
VFLFVYQDVHSFTLQKRENHGWHDSDYGLLSGCPGRGSTYIEHYFCLGIASKWILEIVFIPRMPTVPGHQ